MAAPLRVLAFEPYDGGSHRSVRELIGAHSTHQWTWLTRPARGWKWRMRLAAAELLESAAERGLLERTFDAVFVTSLMSAADLRAMLPSGLRSVPMVLYMHENQAAYPVSGDPKVDSRRDVHFALTNLTSVLSADLVIWNSRWNRDSFLEGMDGIIRRANAVRLGNWQERVAARSAVIWPPVEPPPPEVEDLRRERDRGAAAGDGAVRVAWPHRWEHDKGPDELLELAERYSQRLDIRWRILGWRFPKLPEALAQFEKRFADRIEQFGHEPDRASYWKHLGSCDWVLSTARHDFFGVAVVEALLAGCLPWLPDRLSYRELLPPEARGLSPLRPPQDRKRLVQAIRAHLAPALAPNAVALIDEAIAQAASAPSKRLS
jgi:glycosyltransferase involved in cell wall biosynthesis